MIELFNIPNYTIDTSKFSHFLHGKNVTDFENNFAKYVGTKHACGVSSATNAIFLIMLNKQTTVNVPSLIPPVVLNAILTSGNKINFVDNVDWVGDSYVLHEFSDYKVVDSAQKVKKNQFKQECNENDLMFFSLYPTKPIGSCDGGIIVSDDEDKINWFREATLNGMSFAKNNWERKIKFAGYKMYLNSIQADIANRNFEIYEEKLKKLEKIRNFYNEQLNTSNTSDHLFRINVNERQRLINILKENNISAGIHYSPSHLNTVYNTNKLNLPLSEKIAETTLSIPFHENLTEEDVLTVINKVNSFIIR